MPFQIIRNDITKVKADAVVNTANWQVCVGAGVDSAIYQAAGVEKLLAEREKIGDMEYGQVAITPAFDLPAKYIIHAIGPKWQGGDFGEYDIVRDCYQKSMELAKEYKCDSIAFPLIATGCHGFPKDIALQIAISTIGKFLLENDMTVYLVVYDETAFVLSKKLFDDIEAYIDENYVEENNINEYPRSYIVEPRRKYNHSRERVEPPTVIDDRVCSCSQPCDSDGDLLDELMGVEEETFQERLLRLIDESGLTDVEVYRRAQLNRKLFSKIRCNADYKPKKKTALALALALHLSLEETVDLLGRAELALSPSNKFDVLVSYCIEKGEYDLPTVDAILFQYKQPTFSIE